jgi:hypothetical protein
LTSGRKSVEKVYGGAKFILQIARRPDIIVFVVMEIMSTPIFRTGTFICYILLAGALPVLAQVPASTFEQTPAYAQNVARFRLGARVEAFRQSNPIGSLQSSSKLEDNIAQAALISDRPTVGYALPDGQTEVVLSLSKIENIDIVSFLNSAAGTVTIATSNSKLAVGSLQWHQIAKHALTPKVTKIKIGPTEAKYVKFTFNVAKSGQIADLGVYSTPIPSLMVANTSLAGSEGSTDGKDAKDFGGGKEAKEVAEGPPAEGPPPTLPDPPPFVFVPQIVPVSD